MFSDWGANEEDPDDNEEQQLTEKVEGSSYMDSSLNSVHHIISDSSSMKSAPNQFDASSIYS